jgi:hypothetical protein
MWKQVPWIPQILPQLRFTLGFSLWHIAVPVFEQPMFADLFLRELIQLYNIEFFADHRARTFQIAENFAPIATMENKLRFLRFFCRNTGYMFGIRIPVSLIQIFLNRSGSLQELCQFTLWTFSLAVGVVAKSAGSENPDFTSTDALICEGKMCPRTCV